MAKRQSPYMPMPTPVETRCGCKVSWYYYADEATAREAGKAARHNGEYDASRGYDFGYCSPGSVIFIDPERSPKSPHKGLWEVCVS